MAVATPPRSAAPRSAGAGDPPTPFRPSILGWVARGIVWVAIAWFVLIFPLGQESFEVHQYSQAVIYGIIGLSLNVLLGYVGQISLGHQAFVGIGAFTAAYVVSVQSQSFWIGVLAAVAVGGFQALILGGVSLRITGLYFALVTLAYGLVAEQNIFQIQDFTNGGQGQPAPKPELFSSDYRYYYLCLAFLLVVVWIDWRMMRTKSGRALLALRENPRVASTFGVNVRLATLFAFVVSGVFAGLAGALLASNDTFVSPDTWNFNLALVFVIMTVVGGLRSRTGVIIGSAFFGLITYLGTQFSILQKALNNIPGAPNLSPEIAPLVIGPILLLVVLIFLPGGVGGQIRPFQRWLGGKRLDLRDRGGKEVQITDVRA